MTKVTIDHPTETEWVVSDPATLSHYYALLLPAADRHQLVISVLGSLKERYELLSEVYSCHFYDHKPQEFASRLVYLFSTCRDRRFPIELVFDFGGQVQHQTVSASDGRLRQ